ncbi:MAG: tRNA pseudouridine(38-40) synthase TruA [Thermodesulfobacteriota bacterium]|nr:tRNA pseudouridine(38-40) synthase TruA [Thermodesulfobacteriota bacterium]
MSEQNIQLLISYDGTNYGGWQRQKNSPTIQGIIESKLSVITSKETVVNGAGRTDAGVHALGMVANFKTSSTMAPASFQKALNSMLPSDVRILKAGEAAPDFHARYNSTGKTYRYDFFTGSIQPPAERLYRTHVPCSFKLNKVTACLKGLVGSHDFSSFEASGSRDLTRTGGRGAVRTLLKAECVADPARPEHFSLYFTGDGFLRHMVRNLAGTLFLVGSGRIDRREFTTILAGKDRNLAGPTAPARGLFLEQVHY